MYNMLGFIHLHHWVCLPTRAKKKKDILLYQRVPNHHDTGSVCVAKWAVLVRPQGLHSSNGSSLFCLQNEDSILPVSRLIAKSFLWVKISYVHEKRTVI